MAKMGTLWNLLRVVCVAWARSKLSYRMGKMGSLGGWATFQLELLASSVCHVRSFRSPGELCCRIGKPTFYCVLLLKATLDVPAGWDEVNVPEGSHHVPAGPVMCHRPVGHHNLKITALPLTHGISVYFSNASWRKMNLGSWDSNVITIP